MQILCVIPSRIGSTRLARKPLLPIGGIPMIRLVYDNAARCNVITKVIVATDSTEIADVITTAGGTAILTDPDLPTGSDRAAAVAEQFPEMDIIINLQGDEPFIQPRQLEQLVAPWLSGENPDMTTLARPLDLTQHYAAPDAVKVILDQQGYALYFSRAPIPYFRQHTTVPVYHHIGLYAFRRDFLLHYTKLSHTPLEKAESLEQLRALEHGHKIRVCLTNEKTLEINTPEEYAAAELFFSKNNEK